LLCWALLGPFKEAAVESKIQDQHQTRSTFDRAELETSIQAISGFANLKGRSEIDRDAV